MRNPISLSAPAIGTQTGAALIVALVLLAAITVIGLSNIQSSTLEMKMINSQKQRLENFAMAEAALTATESYLSSPGFGLSRYDLFTDSCVAGKCFTDPCASGLCFDGEYTRAEAINELNCDVAKGADVAERVPYWEDASVWSSGARHGLIKFNSDRNEAKYIIEFLCFVGVDIIDQPAVSDPLFRISVLYEPTDGDQPILLQSTYSFDVNF